MTFDTPKPTRLVERILKIATKPGDTVLDSFAGSGTTAQAVLNANKIDNGNRQFILVELGDYADTVTAGRARRVIRGYKNIREEETVLYEQKLTLTQIGSFGSLNVDFGGRVEVYSKEELLAGQNFSPTRGCQIDCVSGG